MDGCDVAMVIPADCGMTVGQVAAKDVPTGVPFQVVNADDVPEDYAARVAWAAGLPFDSGVGA